MSGLRALYLWAVVIISFGLSSIMFTDGVLLEVFIVELLIIIGMYCFMLYHLLFFSYLKDVIMYLKII